MEGGTYLYGPVDFFGQLGGDSVAYLYPDLQHCIFGTFIKGQLSLGQFCYVATIKFNKGYLPGLTCTTPVPEGPLFKNDPGKQNKYRVRRDNFHTQTMDNFYSYINAT